MIGVAKTDIPAKALQEAVLLSVSFSPCAQRTDKQRRLEWITYGLWQNPGVLGEGGGSGPKGPGGSSASPSTPPLPYPLSLPVPKAQGKRQLLPLASSCPFYLLTSDAASVIFLSAPAPQIPLPAEKQFLLGTSLSQQGGANKGVTDKGGQAGPHPHSGQVFCAHCTFKPSREKGGPSLTAGDSFEVQGHAAYLSAFQVITASSILTTSFPIPSLLEEMNEK